MSVKNSYKYQTLTHQSLTASFISPITFVRNSDNISYQLNVFTTDSIGAFEVQVSNDYAVTADNTVANAGNWTNLVMSATPVVNAMNDTIIISLNQLPFEAIRLTYTPSTPGTGTVDGIIVHKRLGG